MTNLQSKKAVFIGAVLCVAVLGSVYAGGGAQGGSSQPAAPKNKLAFFFPLTGEQMQYGQMLKSGAELAIAQWNAAHGTSYVGEYYDDKGDPKEAVNIANKIVSDPLVIVGSGSFSSSCAMAAAPVFEEKKLLLVSPGASHADFPHMGDYIFSCVISQKYEGAEFARAAKSQTGLKTVAIVYQNTDHGVQASALFRDEWVRLGGQVVAYENYVPGQTNDFSPILSKFKNLNPDIIYVSSAYNDAANIFLQARALNINSQFVGPGMCVTQDFLDLVTNKANGTIILSTIPSFMPSVLKNAAVTPETENFIKTFTAAYNRTPDGFAAQGFDTVNIILSSVEKAGTGSDKLRQEIASLRNFSGISGFDMHFNDTKEMIKGVYMFKVQDGDFIPLN
jgi:branched-chain amino acid transport system substrate-binding protein